MGRPPLLSCRHLRELTLDEHPEGRAAHVSAASGLALAGEYLYVAADDELHLAVFPATGEAVGTLRRFAPGSLPLDPDERKRRKPDIECLALIPAADAAAASEPDLLLGLPSGSAENRTNGFCWELGSCGELVGSARPVDATETLAALAPAGATRNVEGCAQVDDQLWLLVRGNDGSGDNRLARLDAAAVRHSLARGRLDAPLLEEPALIRLGEIDGVPLAFTDATPFRGGALFTCAAEDTTDPYLDGAVLGAGIGWLAPGGSVEWLLRLPRHAGKVEGITVASDAPGQTMAWLVVDDDDPQQASPLLECRIPATPRGGPDR